MADNKRDFKVVENFKWLVLVSIVSFIVAAIFMIVRGSFLNIGVDYKGGAQISIEVTEPLEGDDKTAFEKDIKDFITEQGFKPVDRMQEDIAGEGGSERTYIFTLAYNYDGKDINASDKDEQEEFNIKLSGDQKDDADNGLVGDLKDHVIEYFEKKAETESEESKKAEYLNLVDESAEFVKAVIKGATATSALLRSTIIAIVVAIVVMLVYIIFRFTLSSGLAAVIALAHDVLFMVAFTSIFNIPVNSTFIAAIITIIGYSINATIVIFDKIRECKKSTAFAYSTDTEIANYAIKHSFTKIILSTITTLVMVVALVIFSVATIREFIYPIIFGLIGGTFSSLCLSPAIWVGLRKIGLKMKSKSKKVKKA